MSPPLAGAAPDNSRPYTMPGEKERKIRKARRVELRCTLGFSSGEVEGDATITNISTAGCRAESTINMAEGLDVQVALQLPGQSSPVKVERASARWVSGHAFGLSFVMFFPSERARLRPFTEKTKCHCSSTLLLFDNRHRHLNPFIRQVAIISWHAGDLVCDTNAFGH